MPKIIPKTKQEREAEKQRVKTLYCAGHSITDSARAVGVKQQTAFKWQQREGWKQEISQAKALVQSPSNFVHLDKNIAFDRAKTGKETRDLLSQASLRNARYMLEQPEEMIFAGAAQFKAHVEAAAKIAGTWEDASANRFAIDLHINTLVSSGQIQEVPEGVQIVEE